MYDNYVIIRTIKGGETKIIEFSLSFTAQIERNQWSFSGSKRLIHAGEFTEFSFNFAARRQVEACSSSRMD